jgi:hypothetical protein
MAAQPLVNETLARLLSDLYAQPGVNGACLQVRDTVLVHDLPYSDDRIVGLAKRIDRLIAGYENVGRSIWQICAGFEKSRLLILCRSKTRLSILLKPETDPALIAGRAIRLLMEVDVPEPAPEVPAPTPVQPAAVAEPAGSGISRDDLEELVSGLLARVTGSATATKLIQRDLSKRNGTAVFSRDEARLIGTTILEHVPNRGKREALTSEFLSAIQS